MEVVQYIWDQYVIGLDAPGYHHELLPAVSAVFLLLLSDKLVQCNTVSSLNTYLHTAFFYLLLNWYYGAVGVAQW